MKAAGKMELGKRTVLCVGIVSLLASVACGRTARTEVTTTATTGHEGHVVGPAAAT